jgi:phytanoyl-CoA hydroxylase
MLRFIQNLQKKVSHPGGDISPAASAAVAVAPTAEVPPNDGRSEIAKQTPPHLSVLTSHQRSFWNENGFLVLKGLIPQDQIAKVNLEIERTIQNRRNIPNVRVDALEGPLMGRRVLIAEAPDEAFSGSFKLNDLFLESEIVRSAMLSDQLVAMLAELLDGDPIVINSLSFVRGSGQPAHIDTWYMPPPFPNKLVVSFICLEDIHYDAGPLFYYPGSHSIPPYKFSHGGIHVIESEMDSCREYLDREIAARGLHKSAFLGSTGDVFLWHAQLLHGGMQIRDRARTRKSLVTHYWRMTDLRPDSAGVFDENKYYYKRPHQT